jgi:hypothetical protein
MNIFSTSKIQPLQRRQLAKRLCQQPCPSAANVVPCKATQIQSPISCIAPPNNTTPSRPCKTLQTATKPHFQDAAVAAPSACQAAPPTALPLRSQLGSLQGNSHTKPNIVHRPTKQHNTVKSMQNAANRTSKIQYSQRHQLAERLRQQPCPFAANVVTCKATQIQSPLSCIAPPNNTTPSSP